MINKKIAIAILARDCNEALKRNINEVEKLRSNFKYSIVIVVENDSIDGTKETLYQWKETKENIILLINDTKENTIPQKTSSCPFPPASLYRIEKMANFRNIYLDYIKSNNIEIDFLIVIDIDIKQFKAIDIINAINNAPKDWGSLFAYGQTTFYGIMPYMYDLFAYIPKEYFHEYARKTHEIFISGQTATKLLKSTTYLECISAFGGIGIYKWEIIKNSHYKALPNTRSNVYEAICEHIPINLKIIEMGYKNYICKKLKVVYGKRSIEHIIINSILPYPFYSWLYRKIKNKPFEEYDK